MAKIRGVSNRNLGVTNEKGLHDSTPILLIFSRTPKNGIDNRNILNIKKTAKILKIL